MTKSIDYKALSAELDEMLAKLQSAELDIDESLKCYERGMTIIGQLEAYLRTAENNVAKIKRRFSDET